MPALEQSCPLLCPRNQKGGAGLYPDEEGTQVCQPQEKEGTCDGRVEYLLGIIHPSQRKAVAGAGRRGKQLAGETVLLATHLNRMRDALRPLFDLLDAGQIGLAGFAGLQYIQFEPEFMEFILKGQDFLITHTDTS